MTNENRICKTLKNIETGLASGSIDKNTGEDIITSHTKHNALISHLECIVESGLLDYERKTARIRKGPYAQAMAYLAAALDDLGLIEYAA